MLSFFRCILEQRKHTEFLHRCYKSFPNSYELLLPLGSGAPVQCCCASPVSTHCLHHSPLPPDPLSLATAHPEFGFDPKLMPKTRFRLARCTFRPPKPVREHDFDFQDVDFDLQPEAVFSTPPTKNAHPHPEFDFRLLI